MMTQEEYMDLLALRRQGKTIAEIVDELGYHPATVSGWPKSGGPPPARSVAPAERVIDGRWAERIRQLIALRRRSCWPVASIPWCKSRRA
jgi:hypothetical protein